MSTHAHIGFILGNEITYIYNNYDGDPKRVGKTLEKYYNTPEKVKELISLGDISQLRSRLTPNLDEQHSFSKPIPNVTVAYHRDRGEDWEDVQPKQVPFDKFDRFAWEDYNYLFNLNQKPYQNIQPNQWGCFKP